MAGGLVVAGSHPGLDGHPDQEIVERQMNGGGAVLSLELDGGLDRGQQAALLLAPVH